jgi:glutamine synthetase
MDLEQLITFLEQHGIRKIKLLGADLDGVLRGKYVSPDKLASAGEHGFGFCDVIFGWDVEDACYDFPSVTGWHTGFPDTLARIDRETMRMIPWEPGAALFLCDFWRDPETPLPVCPRNLLKRVAARAEAMGFRTRAAVEYEFWVFRETPQSLHAKGFRNLEPLSPGSFGYSGLRATQNSRLVHDLLDACGGLDVGIEGIHTETGPGAYEAALAAHDVVAAADRAVLFKLVAKEVAHRYECCATFIARWSTEQAGSGGHLHQSLWSADGERNLFHDARAERGLSRTMRHYVGGQAALMGDAMALYCPTVNSYKRIVPGFWAPTRVTWGVENRTAAIRAIPGLTGIGTRVETRVSGADVNPYLGLAAALATGLCGVEREIEPPAPLAGSAYDSTAALLPRTLDEAAHRFRESAAMRDLFGEEFVAHYAATREWEARRHREAVTDWELRRYFEII